MPFKNRIRLPLYLSQAQFPIDKNVFRRADGSSKVLSASVRMTYQGKTDDLPEDWHRKLVIALAHESVSIEDSRLLTDVVIEGDYAIDWQDFLNKPVAQSKFSVQVTPFNATGNNCQSCEEIQQVSLTDDTTLSVFEEGETYDYPVTLTDNDAICCSPFLIEIASFNTIYFTNVTVSQDGILTFTVKDNVPSLTGVKIATYRVTCDNGGYDEADVYGNVLGNGCAPAEIELPVFNGDFPNDVHFDWNEPTPVPAGGYDWALYVSTNLVTPIQSGSTVNIYLDLTGLIEGGSYFFTLISNCGGGNTSTPSQISFIMPNYGRVTRCGNFQINYIPIVSTGLQTYSYMDCNGGIINGSFPFSGIQSACMLLIGATETPQFFAASTAEITINYIDPC